MRPEAMLRWELTRSVTARPLKRSLHPVNPFEAPGDGMFA